MVQEGSATFTAGDDVIEATGGDDQRLGDPALAHLAVGQPADQRCRDSASHAGQDAYDHQCILTAYRKCVTSGE